MYQAIVLLPLLGAIIAGLIALAGARARHPGGGMAPGAEDHAHDHQAGLHGSGAPSAHGDKAVIHETHHEPDAPGHDAHDDHGHAAEPAAQGSRAAELITSGLLLVSAALSWVAFVR